MQKLIQQKVDEFISQGFLILENFVSPEVLLELQESLNSIYEEIDKESNRVEQSYDNKHYGDISKAGRKFINQIRMCSLSANLGDSRTIVTHPASTTHSKLSAADQLAVGITGGMIRLSVGLEHPEDIWKDLNQAITH